MVDALHALEAKLGEEIWRLEILLLVSVRSGAKISMPGMMDTVLNLGLNDRTVEALITATQNGVSLVICHRRFMQMFSEIVLEIDIHKFEEVLEQSKRCLGLEL